MNYNLEIQKILLKSDKLVNYDDQIALLKEAIKIADANRDIDWGFDLRMQLVRTEQYTNHSKDSLVSFAWILDAHDSNPGMFSNDDVLYEYKWIAGVIFNNLDISVEQTDNILDDFRKRLLESGYTIREYLNIKINQSLFKGEKMLAREYLTLRDTEPLDNMSSSSSDITTTIYVEMLEGKFENAIKLVSDRSQPVRNLMPIYCGLIYYLGGKSYDEQVENYFDEAELEFSKMDRYPFQLYELSLMMYYMAKHRKDKAWKYLEEFINWEIGAEDAVRFDFSLSILPLLKNGGKRTIEAISIRHPYYREDKIYDLNDLYKYYREIAIDLAEKFDVRNGSRHFRDQIDEEMNYLNNI